MIGFIGTSITITINYNRSQLMINTCSIPYWTISVFPSTVTDFFCCDCLERQLSYE
jgi:hypothetical protein